MPDSHSDFDARGDSPAELRARLDRAFHEIVGVSWKLIQSEGATWGDLIDALNCYDCVAEQAAWRLHHLLSVPKEGTPQRDPWVWRTILKSRGLELDDTVSGDPEPGAKSDS